MKAQCMRVIDGKILEQCFIPSYVEKKRYRGTWHTGEKILFPGYVFMVSGRLDDLYQELRKVIGLTKLLGTGKEIVPLSEEETALLKRIGAGEGPLEISMGLIENGTVTVTEGPLTGMEGCIRRIVDMASSFRRSQSTTAHPASRALAAMWPRAASVSPLAM